MLRVGGVGWLRERPVNELVDDVRCEPMCDPMAVDELAAVELPTPLPIAWCDTGMAGWSPLPCLPLRLKALLPRMRVVRSGVEAVPALRKIDRRLGGWFCSSALISAARSVSDCAKHYRWHNGWQKRCASEEGAVGPRAHKGSDAMFVDMGHSPSRPKLAC